MRSVTGDIALPRKHNKICDHPRRPCPPDDINDPKRRMNMEIKKNELMATEKFEMPEMEIVNLGMEDVITASCTADGCGCEYENEPKIGLCL